MVTEVSTREIKAFQSVLEGPPAVMKDLEVVLPAVFTSQRD